jgi:deazaflavin-dependent oxidoreductase (nitroreductase family)
MNVKELAMGSPETGKAGNQRYVRPTSVDRWTGKALATMARVGISVMGSRELRVRGRKTGVVRANVVNVLQLDGTQYLLAPRGTTDWVRNLRAAGAGELRLGRRVQSFAAAEVPDGEKEPIMRAYLQRWGFEVSRFFEGLGKSSTAEEMMAYASSFPVFRVNLTEA